MGSSKGNGRHSHGTNLSSGKVRLQQMKTTNRNTSKRGWVILPRYADQDNREREERERPWRITRILSFFFFSSGDKTKRTRSMEKRCPELVSRREVRSHSSLIFSCSLVSSREQKQAENKARSVTTYTKDLVTIIFDRIKQATKSSVHELKIKK